MSKTPLSLLAEYDDLRRCMDVLIDGTAEEEFLRVLRMQEKFREECLNTAQEARRIQKEFDASLKSLADLETKLFHARRLIERESKARRQAEQERDQMEKKICAVADLLEYEKNLKDETKDRIAILKNTLPRKRKTEGELNNTGTFLAELSITQSDDDFLDANYSRNWQKHRPSLPKNPVPCVGAKRSRLSTGGGGGQTPTPNTRRSMGRRQQQGGGVDVQEHTLNVAPGVDQFCATTKVTIPQDGTPIRAESTIETVPPLQNLQANYDLIGDGPHNNHHFTPQRRSASKQGQQQDMPMTPMNPAVHKLFPTPGCQTPAGGGSGQTIRPVPMRKHNFAEKSFLRHETCAHCQKKVRFGSLGLRCRDCPVRCHIDCRHLLKKSCVPQSNTPTLKGLMGHLTDYAPAIAPMVPALIAHCVNEIEQRGFTEKGLYRVSGMDRDVKALKERFLYHKGTPNLSKVDVHVLCSCIKDFLRSLREPLIPTKLWKDFCNAAQLPDDKRVEMELCKAFEKLPQANRDTLAFLLIHFRRIAEVREVQMPIENIARVFGPTIVGYSTQDPDQHAIMTEVYAQCTVMAKLLQIPVDYFQQFVGMDGSAYSDKENNDQNTGSTLTNTAQKNKKELIASLYATPLKSTMKKRFHTPLYKK